MSFHCLSVNTVRLQKQVRVWHGVQLLYSELREQATYGARHGVTLLDSELRLGDISEPGASFSCLSVRSGFSNTTEPDIAFNCSSVSPETKRHLSARNGINCLSMNSTRLPSDAVQDGGVRSNHHDGGLAREVRWSSSTPGRSQRTPPLQAPAEQSSGLEPNSSVLTARSLTDAAFLAYIITATASDTAKQLTTELARTTEDPTLGQHDWKTPGSRWDQLT